MLSSGNNISVDSLDGSASMSDFLETLTNKANARLATPAPNSANTSGIASDDTGALAKLASNTEADFQTNNPTTRRKEFLKSVDPNMVNEDWAKGFELGQQNQRANAAQQNENEKMSWSRTDRMEKRQIDEGMRTAAQEGGYSGVVDYLKTADPERAIMFDDAKQKLDQSMLKTETMASLLPAEQLKALGEGYSVIGKMGMALLNAPDKDKQNLYNTMLPMIRKINPEAPDDVMAATPMFLLAASQATPANLLFRDKNGLANAQSNVAKLESDISKRLAAGADPQTDDALKSMLVQREGYRSKALQAQINLTNTQLNQTRLNQNQQLKIFQANETFNKNLQSYSKDFIDKMSVYKDTYSAVQMIAKDPSNPYPQMVLARKFAMGLNKGAFSENDAKIAFAAGGIPEFLKKIQSTLGNDKVTLNPRERDLLIKTWKGMMQSNLDSQVTSEDAFRKSAESDNYKDLIDWNSVRKPSDQLKALFSQGAVDSKGAPPGTIAPAHHIQLALSDPSKLRDFINYYGYDPSSQVAGSVPHTVQPAPAVNVNNYYGNGETTAPDSGEADGSMATSEE